VPAAVSCRHASGGEQNDDARSYRKLNSQEIKLVQTWLCATFGNSAIKVVVSKPSATPEIWIAGEFVGTVHRDDDEGEVSYNVNIVVLEEDLR